MITHPIACHSVSCHSHYQDDRLVGKCKRPTIRGLELDLAMPTTPSMTNHEPSGSPNPAVAIAKKRATVDASENADTMSTFRVGSGASLSLSSMIATLLSSAYSQFTLLLQYIPQMKVLISPMPLHRPIQAFIRTCLKWTVLLVLAYVILEMNVAETGQHSTVHTSSNPRFQQSTYSNGTSEYAQHQQPRPNKRRRLHDAKSRQGFMTPTPTTNTDPLDSTAMQLVEAKANSGVVASGTGAVSASDSPDPPLLSQHGY